AGPLEVFARASRLVRDSAGGGGEPYSVEIVAREPGPVAMSSGLEMVASRAWREVGDIDTLLIAGGIGFAQAAADRELVDWVVRQSKLARRTASICTGTFLLAAGGLLDGREATTHWAYCGRLAEAAPACRVTADAIFVRDGALWSSAGVTAGMDLALALVEEDLGAAVALAVAQQLVMYVRRPGGQAQFSRQLEAQARDERFGRLHLWMMENLAAPLLVDDLARQAGMSPRHFARRFTAAMGRPPADYLTRLRLEHARRRIEQGTRNLKDIARSSGFGTEQTMRRIFVRELGITPSDYAARFVR
ncbi:MAG: GlxA family transcriptional regulator, partial [Allosphingosinicella sp.]